VLQWWLKLSIANYFIFLCLMMLPRVVAENEKCLKSMRHLDTINHLLVGGSAQQQAKLNKADEVFLI
jgi:hypothetical protein